MDGEFLVRAGLAAEAEIAAVEAATVDTKEPPPREGVLSVADVAGPSLSGSSGACGLRGRDLCSDELQGGFYDLHPTWIGSTDHLDTLASLTERESAAYVRHETA